MPKRIRKTRKNISKAKPQNGFLNRIKFTESYTSLILGAIVILIIGIILLSFAKVNRSSTSSTRDFAKIEDLNLPGSNASSTYTVRPGDDLWTISENVYNDGFRWVEIAKLNKLENPGIISAGDKLSLPKVDQKENTAVKTETQNLTEITNTNSITGNNYTVVKGDNLWNISVRAYGDGFRWVEIARANKLVNPDLIHPGNVFILPR